MSCFIYSKVIKSIISSKYTENDKIFSSFVGNYDNTNDKDRIYFESSHFKV
jgi:hypothetical protein